MITLAPGVRFGSYELVRLLGQGGFAQVWEGRHTGTDRRVALKVLTELRAESTQALERFHQEGRLAASISHPRCVYVYSAEEIEGHPVISMELMSGGTLEERMKAGRLTSTQAADFVLDVIDGLDEANRLGVVHRDVKPSNCFIDADGRARIGDFGISKSLEADSALTQTGAFLGTPYYSSPEQVGGETLDCRADLFSVGAMLYEMLAGKRPFDGINPGMVLTAVLTKEPAPLRTLDVSVPAGLESVVLRLVAKKRENRYQGYAELRAALLPYSSRAVKTSALARRFFAIAVDVVLFTPFSVFSSASAMSKGLGSFASVSWGLMTLMFAYFGLMEGLLGWTLGKRLLGLRVVAVGGERPGLARGLKRAGLFVLVYNIMSIIAQVTILVAGPAIITTSKFQLWGGIGGSVLMLIPLVTMRKRNGFATAQDLVSGTRVVTAEQQRAAAEVSDRAAVPATAAAGTDARQFGSYQVTASLWVCAGEELLATRDAELNRDVWIHAYADESLAPPIERLHARRAGNLPWLQRGTTGPLHWDAYGAPHGRAFTEWTAERGGAGWKELRPVLAAITEELHARFGAFGTAGALDSSRVWIGRDDAPVLLDFPAPVAAGAAPPAGGTPAEVTAAEWRPFLAGFLTLGLGGARPSAGESVTAAPAVPLPGRARTIVARICTDASPFASIDELVTALSDAQKGADEVTRLRRTASLLIPALPSILLLFSLLTISIMRANAPPWYSELTTNTADYVSLIDRAAAAARRTPPDTSLARSERAARIILSSARDSAMAAVMFGPSVLSSMTTHRREEVEKSARMYPAPALAELKEAERWLRSDAAGPHLIGADAFVGVLLMVSYLALGVLGAMALLLAPILRGGLVLHLLGLRLQRLDGAQAERWRAFARAFLAWSPALVFAAVKLRSVRPGSVRVNALGLGPVGAVLALVTIAGAVWCLVRPSRGPADLIAGTIVVPR